MFGIFKKDKKKKFKEKVEKNTKVFVGDVIIEDTDEVFESSGVKVIVDKKSLIYLDGTELDYTKEGLNEGFKFNNPKEKAQCGCGESFTV